MVIHNIMDNWSETVNLKQKFKKELDLIIYENGKTTSKTSENLQKELPRKVWHRKSFGRNRTSNL